MAAPRPAVMPAPDAVRTLPFAGGSLVAEQPPRKRQVGGSNPLPGSVLRRARPPHRGRPQALESPPCSVRSASTRRSPPVENNGGWVYITAVAHAPRDRARLVGGVRVHAARAEVPDRRGDAQERSAPRGGSPAGGPPRRERGRRAGGRPGAGRRGRARTGSRPRRDGDRHHSRNPRPGPGRRRCAGSGRRPAWPPRHLRRQAPAAEAPGRRSAGRRRTRAGARGARGGLARSGDVRPRAGRAPGEGHGSSRRRGPGAPSRR